MNYAKHLTSGTPQTEPMNNRQAQNNAGGYSFQLDKWKQLDRFLILGSAGGTYYVSERKLTRENAKVVEDCLLEDPKRTLEAAVAVSLAGRAPKQDPVIFTLALASVSPNLQARHFLTEAVMAVCRTGTHLFQFVEMATELRGWGKSLRRTVADWYTKHTVRDLAYQMTKYQQRGGWSHSDLLRLSHPKCQAPRLTVIDNAEKGWVKHQYGDTDNLRAILYRWAKTGWAEVGDERHPADDLLPVWAFEKAKRATSEQEIVRLIQDYGLVRECIPTQWLNSAAVWDVLLEKMPITALVRNLGKMSNVGALAPMSRGLKNVVEKLGNEEILKKGRVHPLSLLTALKIYSQGHGDKGKLSWTPEPRIKEALDQAVRMSFRLVEPTGKRWFYGLDVSGSMSAALAGSPVSCCEAATTLALVSASVEQDYFIGRFNTGLEQCPFGPKTSLEEALRYTRSINVGGTDCSLPMVFARHHRIPADVFCVLTDSETYAGRAHPMEALKDYRQRMGIPAKLIVVGMTSTGFTIGDPEDGGCLDVVGMDTDTPAVMSEFVIGQ